MPTSRHYLHRTPIGWEAVFYAIACPGRSAPGYFPRIYFDKRLGAFPFFFQLLLVLQEMATGEQTAFVSTVKTD